ncbi:7934_t:CDS:2 [Acaulospora colombiana]|uniref:7934_t:CDS:1 n=1 Tax=Acaulospora colombiana TaxID=27376 RepID=A0ACA9M9G2_9GLOM|nr:7934_t:CDS:2 [Acaulospora colombiana]
MVFCAECKSKGVYIEKSGQPAEFCSNQCRKAAVEHAGTLNSPPVLSVGTLGIGPPSMPLTNNPPSIRPFRGVGGTWVPVSVPLCRFCQTKPCWKDPSTQIYLSFCGKTCKEAFEGMPLTPALSTPPTPASNIPQSPTISQVVRPNQYQPINQYQPTNGQNQPITMNGQLQQQQPTNGQFTQQSTNGSLPPRPTNGQSFQQPSTVVFQPTTVSPNDRYPPNASDRKITRDDNFDDDNPYGFRDYLNKPGNNDNA